MMGFSKPGTPIFDPKGPSSALLEPRKSWLVNKTGPYAQYGPTLMAYMQSPQEAASGSTQADIQLHTLPHAVAEVASTKYLNGCNNNSDNQMCVYLPTPDKSEVIDMIQG